MTGAAKNMALRAIGRMRARLARKFLRARRDAFLL
jgi:hypothetical protein